MKVLLDTHILIWWVLEIPKLSIAQKKVLASLDKERGGACISVMSLWEIAMLHSLGRLHFDFPLKDWFRELERTSSLQILGLDSDIVLASAELREHLPGDPMDQILVATAKVHGMPLLTADQNIRERAGIAVI